MITAIIFPHKKIYLNYSSELDDDKENPSVWRVMCEISSPGSGRNSLQKSSPFGKSTPNVQS